jgi:hypothetical protein
MSGKIARVRFFLGNGVEVITQNLTLVLSYPLETDAQSEPVVKNPPFHMDDPGPDLDGNAFDAEIEVDNFIAE